MSLNPDDSRRRGRSKSPGGRDERDRSRSRAAPERERSRVRVPSPPSSRYSPPGSAYGDPRDGERGRDTYEYEERTTVRTSKKERDDPRYAEDYRASSPPRRPSYAVPGGYKDVDIDEDVKVRYGDRREKDYYEEKKSTRKPSYKEEYEYERTTSRDEPPRRASKYEYEPESPPRKPSRYAEPDPRDRERDSRRYEEDSRHEHEHEREKSFSISGGINISHGGRTSPKHSPSPPYERHSETIGGSEGYNRYAEVKKWEYAQPDEKISYIRKESYSAKPSSSYDRPSYTASPRTSQTKVSETQVVTVEPGKRRTSGADLLGARMTSLSVSSGHGPAPSLALAPGSPLLESYHGTYQSISPMPSPLMIAASAHDSSHDVNILEISPLSPSSSRPRHARFHDPVSDATKLAKALKGSKSPDVDPLIEILPALTHEQIMDLRFEYKKIVKTGHDKKGVNIAKHIKMRLKEEDSSLMKACYATALGKWESEAYWANFWYQGEKSRRELLIESLMGRSNSEIRAIKDGFSDKKYSDSLTKCMKQELKEDKFKKAILLVLEERRMEERPGHSLDRSLVEDDVRELHKAVRSEKGGETIMITILVQRSDSHIREILRVYEASYRTNFTREMLKKSGNLVGELLAHILNGVINRPVRDALLLNHALTLTKSDSLRTELLISRLVRYHWDAKHMEAVKREYRTRYHRELIDAVREGTKGDVGAFCENLCISRMPDDVRRVERVEIIPGSFR